MRDYMRHHIWYRGITFGMIDSIGYERLYLIQYIIWEIVDMYIPHIIIVYYSVIWERVHIVRYEKEYSIFHTLLYK
jgi:hypothetical protein